MFTPYNKITHFKKLLQIWVQTSFTPHSQSQIDRLHHLWEALQRMTLHFGLNTYSKQLQCNFQ